MKTIDELGISDTPWSVNNVGNVRDNIADTIANMVNVYKDETTVKANARLIAAAPDFYDALQRIVSATEGVVMDFPKWQKDLQKALDDAKKALAKASGEEVK